MKICCRCKITKPVDEFNRSSRSKDGRQASCRPCSSAYYQGNREQHLHNVNERNRRIRLENTERVYRYLCSHPCVVCGEGDPIVLDFDHLGDKFKEISTMLSWSHSWESIEAEIAKCQVLCANCHRRKTAKELGYYRYLAVAQQDRAVAF